jgi:hypothetical protein
MIEAREAEIKGFRYQVTQLPASKGFRMLAELSRIVGPSMGILADATGGKLRDLGNVKVGSDAFGKATEALFARLETSKVEGMLAELRSTSMVQVDGKWIKLPDVWELHFRGRMGAYLQWVKFALEVQFSDFFDLLDSPAPPESSGGGEAPPA